MTEPRVLYVDDEEYMRTCMRETFDVIDLDILTASSGQEALELLASNESVHVVISDYRMPGMNGIEFLSRVAQIAPRTTRILISGFVEQGEIKHALTSGILDHFIHKPWDITSIISLVSKHLEGSDSSGTNQNNLKFMPQAKMAA